MIQRSCRNPQYFRQRVALGGSEGGGAKEGANPRPGTDFRRFILNTLRTRTIATASLAALLWGTSAIGNATVIYQYSASWPRLKSAQAGKCHTTVVAIPAGQGVITVRLKMAPFYRQNLHNRREDVVGHTIADFSRAISATYNGGPPTTANTQEGITMDRIERWEVGSKGQLSTPVSLCNPVHCSGNNCSQPASSANLVVDFAPGASQGNLPPPPAVADPKPPATTGAEPSGKGSTGTAQKTPGPTTPPGASPAPSPSPTPSPTPTNRPIINHATAGAVASQSSVYGGGCPAGANYAIDGVTSAGVAHGCATPIAHTNSENRPWWKVSFPTPRTITKIVVWNRNEVAKERLTNFEVTVRDANGNVVFSKALFTAGGYPNPSVEVPVPSVTGKQVQVQLLGTNFLTLAEVQVFGPAP